MVQYHNTEEIVNSTVCCCRVGRDPVEKEGSSPSLEQKRAPGEEMVDCLGFLLSGVASKSRGNFFQLLNCDRVETAQGFGNNGYKSQTLSSAKFCSPPLLAVVGHWSSMEISSVLVC